MSSTTHGNTKPSPNQEIKPHILHNRPPGCGVGWAWPCT